MQRRLSEESVYTNGPVRTSHDDLARFASTSPNSKSASPRALTALTASADISTVVAGVQPATLAALNPLRPGAGARTTSSRGKPAAAISTGALPTVSRSDFDGYLQEIKSEWARSQRSKALGTKGAPAIVAEAEANRINRLASSSKSSLPSLSVVPNVFQDENFDLANPRTFEEVTSRANEAGPSKSTLGDLASDQILQEKLSHYLDVVELHLTREISVRSASFFAALANLQSLHAQSAQALDRVALLRIELGEVDRRSAATGLAAVRAGLKRRRLESVTRGVERIRELGRAIEQASQLAEAGEWEGALGLVEEVEEAIASTAEPEKSTTDALGISTIAEEVKEPKQPRLQLHRLNALKGVPQGLARLRMQVAKALEADFIGVLSHELEDAVTAYRRAENGPPAWEPGQRERARRRASDRLRPLIRGLLRCGWSSFEAAVATWRATLNKDIRQLVRADLPQSISDTEEALNDVDGPQSTSNKSAALAQGLRTLSHEDFMKLVKSTCLRLAAAIDVAALHSSVILELADAAGSAANADGRAALTLDLGDTVHGSAELANLRFSKIIGVRNEFHAQLGLREFAQLFHEAWAFVVQCETACQRMIVGLRGVLVGQAKAFLQAFHNTRVSASAQLVEVEQWQPADVPSSVQATVDDIVNGAVRDPQTFLLNGTSSASVASTATKKHLVIEERNYFAVAACVKALETLADYIRVVLNLPLLATDAMSRIVEFLKQFNSRTCQVVLGAGAMRSAGLKNITAKHLALASQTLSIMIALIPYIREALRRHLSAKQAVMLTEFDKLKRDFQEHQYEIHAKLVAIMNDRLAVHVKTLQSIDWSVDKPAGVSAYMETLVKETATLHKVLAKYLHGPTLDQVIGQVLSDINAKLADEYGKIELKDADAKARLMVDARFLQTRLAELKGLSRPTPGQELVKLVETKLTTILPPRPPTPPPAKPPTPPLPLEPRASEEKTEAATDVDGSTVDSPVSAATATSVEIASESHPIAVAASQPPQAVVTPATDIARAPSTTGVKNRLAGLFKARSVSTSPNPAATTADSSKASSPILDVGRSSFDGLRSLMPSRSPLIASSPTMPPPTEARNLSEAARTSLEAERSAELEPEVEEAVEVLTAPPPDAVEEQLPAQLAVGMDATGPLNGDGEVPSADARGDEVVASSASVELVDAIAASTDAPGKIEVETPAADAEGMVSEDAAPDVETIEVETPALVDAAAEAVVSEDAAPDVAAKAEQTVVEELPTIDDTIDRAPAAQPTADKFEEIDNGPSVNENATTEDKAREEA